MWKKGIFLSGSLLYPMTTSERQLIATHVRSHFLSYTIYDCLVTPVQQYYVVSSHGLYWNKANY